MILFGQAVDPRRCRAVVRGSIPAALPDSLTLERMES